MPSRRQTSTKSVLWRPTAPYNALPKLYRQDLASLIFEFPYCRIRNVTEREIAGCQTASVYLKELVKIGVLEERAVGREKLLIHSKFMRLLTQESNRFRPYA